MSGAITISPTGEPAPVQPDGEVDLFNRFVCVHCTHNPAGSQAKELFGLLGYPNVFTGDVNTFHDIVTSHLST